MILLLYCYRTVLKCATVDHLRVKIGMGNMWSASIKQSWARVFVYSTEPLQHAMKNILKCSAAVQVRCSNVFSYLRSKQNMEKLSSKFHALEEIYEKHFTRVFSTVAK